MIAIPLSGTTPAQHPQEATTTQPFAGQDVRAISVVIANYNRASFIARTISTLEACRSPIVELIIVDDGSTDHPDPFYGEWENRSGPFPVRILRHPTNRGAATARNTGMRAAKSPLLLLMDSDAHFPAETVDQLAAGIEGVDIAFPRAILEDGNVMNPVNELCRQKVMNSVMFLIRREALERMDEWFDERMTIYGEDPDFFLRAHAEGLKNRFISGAIVHHPVRTVYGREALYHGLRNTVYLGLKLQGIIAYPIPFWAYVPAHVTRFLVSAISGYYFAGFRPTRHRYRASRGTLLLDFARALAWNVKELPALRKKRRALKAFLTARRSSLP